MVTLSDTPDKYGMRALIVDGHTRGRVSLYAAAPDDRRPDELTLYANVYTSESLIENGTTVYRDAVESDDEVQTMSAVVRHPWRVSGVPYRVYAHAEAAITPTGELAPRPGADGEPWRVSSVSVDRLTPGKVTDAAQHAAYALLREVAQQLATPDAIRRAVVVHYAAVTRVAADAITAATAVYHDAIGREMAAQKRGFILTPDGK